MQVPFIDLTREYDAISDDVQDALLEVFDSGLFILGEQGESFEQEFAEYVNVAHGVGVNSGSDALELALQALEVGPGDEVITVSHTFISTANAIVKAGARPVFVDVDPETYCMDPDAVRDAITDDTVGILPVHLYGHPVDMEPITDLAEEHDLFVVEDASQAHGATYNGRPLGSLGDIGCFSLYPTKNLGAYGDAGIAVTDDAELLSKLRSLRDYGRSGKYRHERVANHSRVDEIQAAILRVKLSRLDTWNQKRRQIASLYRSQLQEHVAFQSVHPAAEHAYHLFVIEHPDRDLLQEHLEAEGISSIIHYPIPVHQQPAYSEHDPRHKLSTTEEVASQVLSVPLHPWISDDEVQSVVKAILSFNSS